MAERLRTQFSEADDATKPVILEQLHRRLAEMAPYRVLGQSVTPVAYRMNVSGVLSSPIVVYWNIRKE